MFRLYSASTRGAAGMEAQFLNLPHFPKSSALCFHVRLREEFGFLRRFWCSFRDYLKPKEFKTNPWALNERKTPPVSHQSAAGFPHKIQFSW